MKARMRWIMFVAAMLVPAAALAQHHAAPAKPSVESARPAPPPSQADDPEMDDDLGLGDVVALGFEDEVTDLVDHGDGVAIDEADGKDGGRIGDRRAHGMMGGPGMRMRHGMGGGFMGHGGPGMHARLAELDLSDAQRTKLRDLHEAQARKAVQRRADMQLARLDLHKLMREDRPNVSAVNAQIDKLARLHAEGMKARFETQMQAHAVLTPEQLKQLRSGPGGMHHEMGDFEGWAPPKR